MDSKPPQCFPLRDAEAAAQPVTKLRLIRLQRWQRAPIGDARVGSKPEMQAVVGEQGEVAHDELLAAKVMHVASLPSSADAAALRQTPLRHDKTGR